MADEICSNCGATIGKLQTAYVFHDRVVCYKCDQLLRGSQVGGEQASDDMPLKLAPLDNDYSTIEAIPDTEEKLRDAIQNKTPLEIIYWGGSQPGRKREILPVELKGGLLEAVCLITGWTKNFSIEKIDFSDLNDAKFYNPSDGDHPDELQTVAEIKQELLDKLSACGWHVKKTDCSLEVYLYFKNGKLKKTPEVELFHSMYSGWCVRSRAIMPAQPFEHSSEALCYFLEETKSIRVYRDHLY